MANKRPDGDGLVRKRSDGRWEGRIVAGHKEDGKPIFRSVFAKTQKELMPKLHQAIEEYKGVDLTENSSMTLGEWMEKWLTEYAEPTLRPSTVNGYRNIVKNHIRPALGNKQLRFRNSGWIHPISVFFLIFNHEKHLKNIDPEMQQPIKPPNNALTIATVGSAV